MTKHILITGASSGLGLALAKGFAQRYQNCRLSLMGRNVARLDDVVAACAALGARVDSITCDVMEQDKLSKWITAQDALQPLDIVIANAGISGGTSGKGQPEDFAQVRQIFDVNLRGVFNTIEPAITAMTKRGRGQVAMVSSLAGFRGMAGAPAYSASKAAVRVFGEGLRGALKGSGINVSVICPGFVKTPMTDVNPYKMPFLMSAERAAQIIMKGLAAKKGRIAFPLPTLFSVWLMAALPDSLAGWIAGFLPEKPALSGG